MALSQRRVFLAGHSIQIDSDAFVTEGWVRYALNDTVRRSSFGSGGCF